MIVFTRNKKRGKYLWRSKAKKENKRSKFPQKKSAIFILISEHFFFFYILKFADGKNCTFATKKIQQF